MALDEIPAGSPATSAQINAVIEAVNALLEYGVAIGGTVGATSLSATIASGKATAAPPDSFGNLVINFGVTFAEPPAVIVTGNSGRPNTLVTLNNDSVTTTHCQVHCHDPGTDAPVTNGTVIVNWVAVVA